MTENGSPHPTGPGFSGSVSIGPQAAFETYFQHAEPASTEDIEEAAKLIAKHRETEGLEDAFSVCSDIATAFPNPTTVMAEMITTGHEAVPKRWRTDPEDIKMVISMVGYMEIGRLHAQEAAVRRGPGFPGLAERIFEIEQLMDGL